MYIHDKDGALLCSPHVEKRVRVSQRQLENSPERGLIEILLFRVCVSWVVGRCTETVLQREEAELAPDTQGCEICQHGSV